MKGLKGIVSFICIILASMCLQAAFMAALEDMVLSALILLAVAAVFAVPVLLILRKRAANKPKGKENPLEIPTERGSEKARKLVYAGLVVVFCISTVYMARNYAHRQYVSGFIDGYQNGTQDTKQKYSPPIYYNSVTVYVTPQGEKYHEKGCQYLKSEIPITLKEAHDAGYTPCSVCNPPEVKDDGHMTFSDWTEMRRG